MARIRTVKPDFFRHELLQDLEVENPGKYPMLVFEGLWTQCDSQGVFVWNARQLHLDILPFIQFDFEETLTILFRSGLLRKFESDGKSYGYVQTFKDHQRLTGKEATNGKKYPTPENFQEAPVKHPGNNGEAPVKHPGAQEKEREKERNIKAREGGVGETKNSHDCPVDNSEPVDNSQKELSQKDEPQSQNLKHLFARVIEKFPPNRDCNWHLFFQKNNRCRPDVMAHALESVLKHSDLVDNPIAYCERVLKMENMNYNARDHETEARGRSPSKAEATKAMEHLGEIFKQLGVGG